MKKLTDIRENQILKMLEAAGYEAYFVGGCVRDELMGAENHRDIDVATNALPEEIKQVFSQWQVIETGIKHGTVTVLMPQYEKDEAEETVETADIPIEITTYRYDSGYSDSRHPDEVRFVTSLKEDLQRRDFTINAIACDAAGRINDPFAGVADLKAKVIRTVGDPRQRLTEDALRIMRALRFSATLDFVIEEKTAQALFENKALLKYISAERIFAELKKLLSGKNAGRVIRQYVDILGEVVPELCEMKGFLQHNPYHRYDVLEHCVRALENVNTTARNREYMKLAALFHDIGKPQTYSVDAEGIGHFYKHSHRSSVISKDILRRLKADGFTVERVGILTKYHDLVFEKDPRLLKRWMNRFTPEILVEILEIKRADNLATGNMSEELACKFDDIEKMINNIIEEKQCFTLKDLAVNGDDILQVGAVSGPEVGKILHALLENVIADKLANQGSVLEEAAKEMIKENKKT